jgi:hypothetical protein
MKRTGELREQGMQGNENAGRQITSRRILEISLTEYADIKRMRGIGDGRTREGMVGVTSMEVKREKTTGSRGTMIRQYDSHT